MKVDAAMFAGQEDQLAAKVSKETDLAHWVGVMGAVLGMVTLGPTIESLVDGKILEAVLWEAVPVAALIWAGRKLWMGHEVMKALRVIKMANRMRSEE